MISQYYKTFMLNKIASITHQIQISCGIKFKTFHFYLQVYASQNFRNWEKISVSDSLRNYITGIFCERVCISFLNTYAVGVT